MNQFRIKYSYKSRRVREKRSKIFKNYLPFCSMHDELKHSLLLRNSTFTAIVIAESRLNTPQWGKNTRSLFEFEIFYFESFIVDGKRRAELLRRLE